jgi:hypothetical protein
MTNSRSTPRNTHWLAIAGLAIAGLAMNVGCSSSNPSPSDSGAGGGTGAGGSGAGGKDAGSTDTQVVHNINYTFDTDLQGWAFSTYADPTTRNLTGAYLPDGGGTDTGSATDGSTSDANTDGAVADGGSTTADAGSSDAGPSAGAPTLEWDSAVGQPSPGSMKISVTFTDCNQYVDPGFNFPTPKNETGHMLHARMQVTSGTFSGGAQLHVTTGSAFDYGYAPVTIQPDGTFALVTLDLTNPQGAVNPAQVVGMGLQIYSGGICPYPNAGTPVVFNIDTVVD